MEVYVLTDTSQVKTMNQDHTYSSPEEVGSLPSLFLVANGMDGHRAGDYASWFAAENLVICVNRAGDSSPIMQLEKGIEVVNGALYEESLKREELEGTGCTLVAGVVGDNTLYVTNVGNNRLHLIHGDSIRQITRDHSYMEEMAAIGQMRGGSEDYNRRKNIITRALGIGREVEPDFFEVDLEGGDYILLCSDGLSSTLEDQSMYGIITGEGNLKGKTTLLIEEASRQGGIGNIAVVLVSPSEREADVC